ncbi:hypothetical protein DFO45_2647 [Azorhizobium sp. AG788]|uniref:hypothetical protein n=1 Tax=Azorhizobium sp. AG788 TaxID=2183897 RepID=UPI00105D3C8F|nr:hypothetical protein [Azorhizobium sp. AG788]TDT94889.1 hypothetical protein DFO45_2647 [Azorhizobium sp. AG788]
MDQRTPPDDTPHRLALWRLVKVAQDVITADGPDADLARKWHEMPDLIEAVGAAASFARTQERGQMREAWPLLAQACNTTLRHIFMSTGTLADRDTASRWQSIVGALYPLVHADWQAWRDERAPKLGGV